MWDLIKIPKSIALAAFLMPWMTVSCSGQKLMSATGWNLTTGNISVVNPMTGAIQSNAGSPNLFLGVALLAIAFGLLICFRRGRSSARAIMATSAIAVIGILLGTKGLTSDAIARAAAAKQGGGFDAAMAAALRIDWQTGYWVTLFACVVAGGMAWMSSTGKTFAAVVENSDSGSLNASEPPD